MRPNTIVASLLGLALVGCGSGQDDTYTEYTGPGTVEWASEDLSCEINNDCLAGEACIDSLCQVDRCGGDLPTSLPPLGDYHFLFREDEIALADSVTYEGEFWVDGFQPATSSYDGSWSAGTRGILDIAGGTLLSARPSSYVAATSGSRDLRLVGTSDVITLDFNPSNVAAGDVDGDGLDEIIATSSTGDIAVCDAETGACDSWTMSNTTIIDVAAADMDGDVLVEPILLIESGSRRELYVFNIDASDTGQPESWSAIVSSDTTRIAGGDLDGDRLGEIIALVDSGWMDQWVDNLEVWIIDDGSNTDLMKVTTWQTDGHAGIQDIATGDADMDDEAEVYMLDYEALVITAEFSMSTFVARRAQNLSPSAAPTRIAAADHDGDAPIAWLKGDAQECQGNALPIMFMMFPPYDQFHSDGTPSVTYGDAESTGVENSDSVSLGLGVDVGYKQGFGEVFGAKVSASVNYRTTHWHSVRERRFVSNRFSLKANPALYGPNYGGVVLSWGCFDGYKYRVDDPNDYLGGADREDFVVTVPTGGGTSLWSSTRYNALASELGHLPLLEVPYQVGTTNYPLAPETIQGDPMSEGVMLFPDPYQVVVSDIGTVGWYYNASTDESNGATTDISIGASMGITVGGFQVGVNASYGWGTGYTLSVGESALFVGSLPPLPDDMSTPEDEYGEYAYAMTPYVYLQDYVDAQGNESFVYVQTYTVENQ